MTDHRCWPPRPNRQDSPWHCGCGKVWVCDGGHSQWTEVPAPKETPAVPSCQICGAAMQMVIDMGRVEAGVGGPRPTYMCPEWKNHP